MVSPNKLQKRITVIFAAILVFVAPSTSLCGKSPLDRVSLEEEIQSLSEKALTNPKAAQALEVKKETLQALEEITDLRSLQTTFNEEIASAPKESKELQFRLAEQTSALPETESLSEEALDTGLAEASLALDQAKTTLGELRQEEGHRSLRRQQLPEEIARARSATTREVGSSEEDIPSTQSLSVTDSLRLGEVLTTLRSSKEKTLSLEQQHLDATDPLLSSQIVLAIREVDERGKQLDTWRTALEKQRVVNAVDLSKEARSWEDKFSDLPAIAGLLASNREMAEGRLKPGGINAQIADAQKRLTRLEIDISSLEAQRASAIRRVTLLELANLTIDAETGNVLRRERESIPSAETLRGELRQGVVQATRAQLELISLEDTRRGTGTGAAMDQEIREVIEAQGELVPSRKAELDEALRSILKNRDEIKGALITDQRNYLEIVSEANSLTAQLAEESASFARFIDERLLWIRNAGLIGPTDLKNEATGVRDLIGSTALRSLLAGMWEDIRRSPAIWIAVISLLILLILRRPRRIDLLTKNGELAIKRNCTSFLPTLKALGHSLILASPIPLAIGFLAWRCGLEDLPFKHGVLNMGIFLTLTGVIWVFARPQGLFTNHLGMGGELARHIRRNLRWFVPIMLLPIFLASALTAAQDETTLGRVFFILAMIIVAIFGFLLLRPCHDLVPSLTRYSWLPRISFLAAVVLPLALAAGAALGYFSSVQLLRVYLVISLWAGIGVLLISSLLSRILLVSRRQLSIKQALARRNARARKLEDEGEGNSGDKLPSVEEVMAQAVDITSVNQQARRLLRMGSTILFAALLYGIWSSLLPALSVLDRVPIWNEGASVASSSSVLPESGGLLPEGGSSETESNGVAASASRTITLQDLLSAIVIFSLTLVFARNIPALLELTILPRLDLAAGGSFAITTSVRYLIVIVGVVWGFSQIGITWGKVQWIAAAVTLGIGFGLQEVFANFVAGIILLFERPMRIGDYVTVGELSGQVTRIEMRATTIRDFSHKELIVPNKEFITGQLVNWTLSDAIVRIEIPVGVAYGSDTELVKKTLMVIGNNTPQALEDPAPQVIFKGFGDSTLNFELRIHITGADEMVQTKSRLHFAIDEAFREADIEIAFPQQDLHIRTMPSEITS